MYLLDSNVWIALYNPNDSSHQRSKADFEKIASEHQRIVISDHVLSEVFTHILYRFGRQDALAFLDEVLNNPEILIHTLNSGDIREISEEIAHSKPKLSFTDEVLRFLSDRYGYWLLTYDKDLAKAK